MISEIDFRAWVPISVLIIALKRVVVELHVVAYGTDRQTDGRTDGSQHRLVPTIVGGAKRIRTYRMGGVIRETDRTKLLVKFLVMYSKY